LGCGVERITDIAGEQPKSMLIYTFPGSFCGVPTIVGHYFIQSVYAAHALAVLDISNPAKPVQVAWLKIDETFGPHWTGWDERTQRLVVTGYGEDRLFMLKFDQRTGALAMDTAFRGADGQTGLQFR
jgi:hypothetical protein